MPSPLHEHLQHMTRRCFLGQGAAGLGAMWLAQQQANSASGTTSNLTSPRPSRIEPRAKRVIYLHMTGAPSPLDLFSYKPDLEQLNGEYCPQSFLEGQRFAFITGKPKLMGPMFPFHRHATTGQWVSDRLPHFEKVMDRCTFIQSMQTEQFNHAPAQLLILTGNQNLGYASVGSWSLYGLGSENENLPGYVVLLSGGALPDAGKASWASGFLPSVYQGVQCRGKGDPVLYLSNPEGIDRRLRGEMIETLSRMNQRAYQQTADPETLTRIAQYELAFRMQVSASDAMNLNQETKQTHELYGTTPGEESFANNCLLARRLVERGVRFVQLFDWGWDHHNGLKDKMIRKCQETDRPIAALLIDLEQRGLLEDTLVVWGGEFGRTPMLENRGGSTPKNPGRDHHKENFTVWLAGAGVKRGAMIGETDPIGFHVTSDPVQVRDFHATLLHLLGLDFHKLSFPFQGLDQKLTGVKPARIVEEVFA